MVNCFMTRRRNSGGMAEPATIPNLIHPGTSKSTQLRLQIVEIEYVLERCFVCLCKVRSCHFSNEHSGDAVERGAFVALDTLEGCGGIVEFGRKDKGGASDGAGADGCNHTSKCVKSGGGSAKWGNVVQAYQQSSQSYGTTAPDNKLGLRSSFSSATRCTCHSS